MKQFYLLALVLLAMNLSFAAPTIKVANSAGSWKVNNTWDLNRRPQNGDTILVPAGKTVIINDQQYLNNVHIKVWGTLKFNNALSFLSLNNLSTVQVFHGGKIEATLDYWQYIFLGGETVFAAGQILGPQQANASTGSGFNSFNPLPVTFVGFTVSRKNASDVQIKWSTSEEHSADMYELERSYDGSNWNVIAYVAAVGNSANLNSYSFSDKNVSAKTIHYRIRQVDIDGRFTYTSIKSIRTDVIAPAAVNIAGVQGKVLLQFPAEVKGALTVRFIATSGQVVDQQTVNQPSGQVVLTPKVNVKGSYVIAVSNGQDISTAKQILL